MKRHKKRTLRLLTLSLALMLMFSAAFLPGGISFAGNDKKTVDEYKDDLDDINKQIDSTKDALSQGKAQASALATEIRTLDKRIYSSEVEINNLTREINGTKEQIAQKFIELEAKQAEVNEQNDSLNMRLRTMYKKGDVGVLSVLLGSKDIAELLTNIEMISRIYKSDADLLEELQLQYKDIEGIKDELLALKARLEEQQANVETKKAALAADKQDVAQKKAQVDADNKELAAQIDAMNKEASALTAKILAMQSSADYVGGDMVWPSDSSRYISSPYGNRIHPILRVYKMHTGIDIAARSGTNILAANAGIVMASGWNNSYGYMVMLDHGGGIVTLYAHASKLLVRKGDVVGRGEVIALVGSTGRSTGPHIHFEVRINGEYKNPLNYVSP